MSPRSIDTHAPDCPCPPCAFARGEGRGQAPKLSVRMAPDILEWLHARPEGPRAFIERAARAEMGRVAPDRDWWHRHIVQVVSGAIREVQRAHGELLPASVGKRVAAQLWQELFGRQDDDDPAFGSGSCALCGADDPTLCGCDAPAMGAS